MPIQNESDLYEPIKQYLEDRGYSVKGEVRGVDLVAYHPDREPVLIELKKTFNLKLVFQGIDRLTLSDRVYLAVSASSAPGNVLNQNQKSVKKLCRRIGLGLIQVYFGPRKTRVDILVESGPYQPRKQKLKFKALHEEFTNRKGDPSVGGITRQKIMTAYRQQVVEVAACVAEHGDYSLAEIRESTGVKKTSSILQKNHYGWFERVARGRYRLTDLGKEEFESLVAESVE
ncbi:MAG: DUF2161 family putative PD-(D/E)XK-type phosphodiesterase [Verrucomicrobia bacterium]|nr:DUF2161 family putative PD-(D/E)XK-type phosphodiesterase [Verrucomicrobiota bacterium]